MGEYCILFRRVHLCVAALFLSLFGAAPNAWATCPLPCVWTATLPPLLPDDDRWRDDRSQSTSPIYITPYTDVLLNGLAVPGSVPSVSPLSTGHTYTITTGADINFGSTFLLGAGVSYSRSTFDTPSAVPGGATGKVKSDSEVGYVRGIYYFWKYYNVGLTVGHGFVSSDSTVDLGAGPIGISSSGDTTYISANLGATFDVGVWRISPIFTVTQSQTITNGTRDELGRATLGSEVGYKLTYGKSTLVPGVRASYAYDYEPSIGTRDKSTIEIAPGATWYSGALTLRGELIGTFRDDTHTAGGRVFASWRF